LLHWDFLFAILASTSSLLEDSNETARPGKIDRDMSLVTSLELRWFFDESLSKSVEEWFRKSLPDSEISDANKRDDTYLLQPSLEDFGIKLREGKLEIKWREFAEPHQAAYGISGQIERWHKWDWSDAKGPTNEDVAAFCIPAGPWITVEKARRQRKYRWESGFVPASPKEILSNGVAVEITELTLQTRRYSSVLIESFAPELSSQRQLLMAGLEYLWRDYPKPMPPQQCSYGYPRWLRTVAASGGK
jgi:hypothetical protein